MFGISSFLMTFFCCWLQLHDTTSLESRAEPPFHAGVVLVDPTSTQSIEDAIDAQEQLGAMTPVLFVGVSGKSNVNAEVRMCLQDSLFFPRSIIHVVSLLYLLDTLCDGMIPYCRLQ